MCVLLVFHEDSCLSIKMYSISYKHLPSDITMVNPLPVLAPRRETRRSIHGHVRCSVDLGTCIYLAIYVINKVHFRTTL